MNGIGRAIALSFARAGAAVIGVADTVRNPQLQADIVVAAKQGGHAMPTVSLMQLDITDELAVNAMALQHAAHGDLDVLVNNAGFMTPACPVPSSDADAWWRTFEVNLKGTYLMAKHFLPLLLSSGPGRLKTMININSVAAHNLRPMASAYGTSKAAALKLTEFLMVEAGGAGLLAYSVHPGAVRTELAEHGMPPETLAGLGDGVDLAGDTVCWLASERREWLAGRYISATWDMEELMEREEEIVAGDKLKVRLVVGRQEKQDEDLLL